MSDKEELKELPVYECRCTKCMKGFWSTNEKASVCCQGTIHNVIHRHYYVDAAEVKPTGWAIYMAVGARPHFTDDAEFAEQARQHGLTVMAVVAVRTSDGPEPVDCGHGGY